MSKRRVAEVVRKLEADIGIMPGGSASSRASLPHLARAGTRAKAGTLAKGRTTAAARGASGSSRRTSSSAEADPKRV